MKINSKSLKASLATRSGESITFSASPHPIQEQPQPVYLSKWTRNLPTSHHLHGLLPSPTAPWLASPLLRLSPTLPGSSPPAAQQLCQNLKSYHVPPPLNTVLCPHLIQTQSPSPHRGLQGWMWSDPPYLSASVLISSYPLPHPLHSTLASLLFFK